MTSLTNQIPPTVKYKIFADDIILYRSSSTSQECTSHLQRALSLLNSWASKWGFVFSPSKSSTIHFCKHRNCPKTNLLYLSNINIPSTETLRILGLLFDSKLSWTPHIKLLKNRTATDLNLMRVLSNTKWGADLPSLLTIYKSLILAKLSYGDFIYDAASSNSKKLLDTIQNQALRLSSGAFRTSPISSLQCITSTPPLQLIRHHSLLKYYITALYRPHTKESLNLFNVHRPNQLSPPNSIQKRISSLLSLYNLTPPKFSYPLYSTFPPWHSYCPHIDFSMQSYSKHEYSKAHLNKLFQELVNNKYLNHFPLYTDGSKTDHGVGAASYSTTTTRMFKLPNHSTVFSAELLAIKEAIRIALSVTPANKFLIISDSRSALLSIRSKNMSYNYIRQIYDLLYIAKLRLKQVVFCWMPSHINNYGNDRADHYARLAIDRGICTLEENHPSDYNKLLQTLLTNLFQLKWDLENPNNKLWHLKSQVTPPLHSTILTRTENVIMRRLAIGHTYSTHSHLLKREQAPLCTNCEAPLTVKHVFESTHFKTLREQHDLPSSLQHVITSFEAYKTSIKDFLRHIEFKT